jgi:hypothetical protein
VAYAFADRGGAGLYFGGVVGEGSLLAYTVEERCDPDAPAEDAERCPGTLATVSTTVRAVGRRRAVVTRRGALKLLAVDSGRLVVATGSEVTVLTAHGRILRRFAIKADTAALSENQLAVEGTGGISVYEIKSARRVAHFAAADSLADLDAGILVYESRGGLTLRRLSDRRTVVLRTSGDVHAQLQRSGLFVASPHRITFTPMRELLRSFRG